ncbi:MAG: hypothetical protein A3B37_00575 [Candidatus Sungbacteria bacterium RIFCSPLOWO2_01_FULL_59_16]|uniref:Uncharacterized protein n=1 Tax=Candidatus Sungbacteria bacterium RIFCSPLOWO2_01_FULL_59_16 TaxID=1802280 RepID=A0A1G2LB63_9BACT|nr:MAG: hypothetical protein A3B37_00575 [Candidatus Sungbacteria bacterium RIFCSPLOWO2_01_FULL_59_16]
MKQTLESIGRQIAHQLVDEMPFDKLLQTFGPEILQRPLQTSRAPRTASELALASHQELRSESAAPSPLTKKRRDLTPAEADEIRRRLKGIRFGTPKYERIRDELGAKLGINRRQIYGAWRAWKALKRRKR